VSFHLGRCGLNFVVRRWIAFILVFSFIREHT
jgi:hypothetical protein